MPEARLKKFVDDWKVVPLILYNKPEPIGEVTVIVPCERPLVVCVIPATGVMLIPKQGLTGTGTGIGVVSDFEHAANKTAAMIRE